MVYRLQVCPANSNLTNYIYPEQNGGDANELKTNFHRFVFNMTNTPTPYGFLDVTYFDGTEFTPATPETGGVVRQRFTTWVTGNEYIRCWQNGLWSDWNQTLTPSDIHTSPYSSHVRTAGLLKTITWSDLRSMVRIPNDDFALLMIVKNHVTNIDSASVYMISGIYNLWCNIAPIYTGEYAPDVTLLKDSNRLATGINVEFHNDNGGIITFINSSF